MDIELEAYKANKIAELNRIFNAATSRLNSTLATNIRSVQFSRNSAANKQRQINTLRAQYTNNIASLTSELNRNVAIINMYQPATISISTSTANKRALLIGINYVGTANELRGCINDVLSIKERLLQNGFSSTNITMLTDSNSMSVSNKPTRANILRAFTNLLNNSREGDLLFFAYSGHGSYTIDRNRDETTGYDQMIVPSDLTSIVDDELKSLIQRYLKKGVTLFAMFDSCFSGTVLDLKYQFYDTLHYDKYTENASNLETLGNVIMISGCSDYQTSADAYIQNRASGAMTWSLLETKKQKPNCSWRELIKHMRLLLSESNYDQIPQLSTGKFEDIDLPTFI